MALRETNDKDEQKIDFSHSDKKNARKLYGSIGGVLVLFLALGFTLRTPPKPVTPTLTKMNTSQVTAVGNIYYIGTSLSASKKMAQSLYYIDAPQTDGALSIKVTATLTAQNGNAVESKVYQAGAHIFAIEYKPQAKLPIISQSIAIKNLSIVSDEGTTNEAQAVSDPFVVKPNNKVKYQVPNYRHLITEELVYQINLYNKEIAKQGKTLTQATNKLNKDNQTIDAINAQNKTNLTEDQLNANQSQVDALTADVATQQANIAQAKAQQQTLQENLKKAINVQEAVKKATTDDAIAKALG
ncbi:hypothetical protein [Lactococcus allomyrinae]|uniref:Uncharacterized protein n=1 Tax=Lactococcus allomyrinae TaxID=2419773 RepID=A0A387B7R4_9LACT|nr:hypothetical protein [Lactococcus allomyrinae]AYF99834.1 hypothetical protein D7I46_01280 [Lactococcus allomyrinae]